MKHIINSEQAPAPIGPYNQAVKIGHMLYTSGQIPLDPETGLMIEGGIKEQAIQVFANLKAVLEAAGATFDDVVKTTVFLTSMDNFPALNEVYAEYFEEDQAPARSTVAVADLPKGSLVEIELVAKV
jgi:2-iminobutanoate/2-iminopropanoate deaminase